MSPAQAREARVRIGAATLSARDSAAREFHSRAAESLHSVASPLSLRVPRPRIPRLRVPCLRVPRLQLPCLRVPLLLGAALLLLGLGACGGGSGGGGSSNNDPTTRFHATYHFMGFGIQTSPNHRPLAQRGVLTSDGVGFFDGSSQLNSAGVIVEDVGLGEHFFVESEERELIWYPFNAPDLEEGRGRVSESGNVAAMTLTLEGTVPGLLTNIRKEGFWNLSRLDGTYHVAGIRSGAGGHLAIAQMGTATFDGIGGLDLSLSANSDGTASNAQQIDANYLVTIEGSVHVQIPFPGEADLVGGATPDADLIVVCGGRIEGQVPEMLIFVRMDASLDTEAFDGEFGFFALEWRGANSIAARVGTLTSDGVSGFTLETRENLDGVPGTSPTESGSFSVSGLGQLNLTYGGRTLVGGLDASSRFAAAAGSTNEGEPPTLAFLLR